VLPAIAYPVATITGKQRQRSVSGRRPRSRRIDSI